MTAQRMFSHTKEILALTVPIFTVLVVVSLMTAGAVSNSDSMQNITTQDVVLPTVIVSEPSAQPTVASSIAEEQRSATDSATPTVTRAPDDVLSGSTTGSPAPTATPSATPIQEDVSTQSADTNIDND